MIFIMVMLRKALQHLIDDRSFHLAVEPAATALQQANCVLDWGCQQANTSAFKGFEKELVQELSVCFPSGDVSKHSFVTIRSDICRSYHSIRTSPHFVTLWCNFVKKATTCQEPQPVFYQEVTDLIFEELLQSALPVNTDNTPSEAAAISYEDANAIHYTAGYVCRKTYNKIQCSNLPAKTELTKCVMGLLKDNEEEAVASSAADWVNEVDRGGLWKVQEGTYMLFASMEEEVREHFQTGHVRHMKDGFKERVSIAVSTNDEVLFHWCMLTAEIEEVHAQVVLDMLITLWITIRGFSFASAFLEMYKQEKKRGLQQSKALRKDIH